MKLLIAIPALNEEKSIQRVIQGCIAARNEIMAHLPVTEVDITVVSDGSTDRTVEIATRFTDRINLIVFEGNRGYGAAIKEAWRQSDAELLGFLDADGTCDPRFFLKLCSAVIYENVDVALGCRLNEKSKMPLVRKVGNMFFSKMLSVLSSSRVRDTASGMRVVRRESLLKLLPLPDGMHFTPAMSARALLSKDVRIREVDMPYHEREGESKLRLGKDGVRFLKAILEVAMVLRPAPLLAILGLFFLTIACVLMLSPVAYYLRHHAAQEWMIYRFVVSHLIGAIAFLLFSVSYLSARVVQIALPAGGRAGPKVRLITRFINSWTVWLVSFGLMVIGGLLVLHSFIELVQTGHTSEHWSRFIAMSFLWLTAFILIGTRLTAHILTLLEAQVTSLRNHAAPASHPSPKSAVGFLIRTHERFNHHSSP